MAFSCVIPPDHQAASRLIVNALTPQATRHSRLVRIIRCKWSPSQRRPANSTESPVEMPTLLSCFCGPFSPSAMPHALTRRSFRRKPLTERADKLGRSFYRSTTAHTISIGPLVGRRIPIGRVRRESPKAQVTVLGLFWRSWRGRRWLDRSGVMLRDRWLGLL